MTRSCLIALFALIILAGCSGHVSQDEGVPAMSARTPDAEPLLTPAEVATMFRVDPKTVTR